MPADADVLAAVDARQADGLAAMRFVHDHPELGHEEHECAGFLADRLEAGGFEVERGAGGMATAFRAASVNFKLNANCSNILKNLANAPSKMS